MVIAPAEPPAVPVVQSDNPAAIHESLPYSNSNHIAYRNDDNTYNYLNQHMQRSMGVVYVCNDPTDGI